MTRPSLNHDDPELVAQLRALALQPEDLAAQDAVRASVDGWLLRTATHRPSTGRQLATWFAGATGRATAVPQGDCNTMLAQIAKLYEMNYSLVGASFDSGSSWTYERLVSGPNPKKALIASGEKARTEWKLVGASMTDADSQTPSGIDALADGFDHTSKFYYFCMPLRAAFLRAILLAWATGATTFDRLVEASVGTSAVIPTTRMGVGGRTLLALLVTEALDDATYVPAFAGPKVENTDYEDAEETLTPAGQKLLALLQAKLRPPTGFDDPPVKAAVQEYAALRKGERTVASAPGHDTTIRKQKPFPFDAIIVPGYTALDTLDDPKRVSAVGVIRLQQAIKDLLQEKLAPFIVVSGGGVYPLGTQKTEAQLMYDYLTDPKSRAPDDPMLDVVPSHMVVREACARHSTTNLRNVTRFLYDSGLDGPYLITTGGDEFLPKWATDLMVGAGVAMGVAGTAAIIAGTQMKDEDDQKLAIGLGIAGNALGSLAVVGGVMLPLMDDQIFYFQNPYWSTYNGRCMTELGYRPHFFIGDPAEWCAYAESGPGGASAEPLDGDTRAKIKARWDENKTIYEKVENKMHAVMYPSPRSSKRYNMRDPLDP